MNKHHQPIFTSASGAAMPAFPPVSRDCTTTYPQPIINCQEEIWKTIKGYPNYMVSNRGRVVSLLDPDKPRFIGAKTACGYVFAGLRKSRKEKLMRVHRLVAIAFLPNPERHASVLHKDDNKQNNHVDNLYWGSHWQNSMDAERNGRIAKGSKRPGAKLNEAAVREIRESRDVHYKILAEKYGVSQATIYAVIGNRLWRHV